VRASAFGQVAGTSSILTIQTDLLGVLTITEQDPQLPQTAYGVLADLLEIAAGRK
jgi:homoserine dehydrogenase